MHPKVSIVINNYNYGRFLNQSINSCLNQAYDNLEVIVVDDGSTDDSCEQAKQFADRIIFVKQQNKGQAAACNHGASICTGEIIWFLDSDDYLLPGSVHHVVNHWDPTIAMIGGRLKVVNEEGRHLGYRPPRLHSFADRESLLIHMIRTGNAPFAPSSGNAYGRAFLSAALPIPEETFRHGADAYLRRKLPFLGTTVLIDENLAVYRVHNRGLDTRSMHEPALLRERLHREEESYQLISEEAFKLGIQPSPALILINEPHIRSAIIARAVGVRARRSSHYTRLGLLRLAIRNWLHLNRMKRKKIYFIPLMPLLTLSVITFTPRPLGKAVVRILFLRT